MKEEIRHLYHLIDKGFYKQALPSGGLEPLKVKGDSTIRRVVEITDVGEEYFSRDSLELEITFADKSYKCRCINLASTDPNKAFIDGTCCERPLCFASAYALAMERASKIRIELVKEEEES